MLYGGNCLDILKCMLRHVSMIPAPYKLAQIKDTVGFKILEEMTMDPMGRNERKLEGKNISI